MASSLGYMQMSSFGKDSESNSNTDPTLVYEARANYDWYAVVRPIIHFILLVCALVLLIGRNRAFLVGCIIFLLVVRIISLLYLPKSFQIRNDGSIVIQSFCVRTRFEPCVMKVMEVNVQMMKRSFFPERLNFNWATASTGGLVLELQSSLLVTITPKDPEKFVDTLNQVLNERTHKPYYNSDVVFVSPVKYDLFFCLTTATLFTGFVCAFLTLGWILLQDTDSRNEDAIPHLLALLIYSLIMLLSLPQRYEVWADGRVLVRRMCSGSVWGSIKEVVDPNYAPGFCDCYVSKANTAWRGILIGRHGPEEIRSLFVSPSDSEGFIRALESAIANRERNTLTIDVQDRPEGSSTLV